MIAAALVWLFQDMFQVLAMGLMLAPEFFLLVSLYGVVSRPLYPTDVAKWIWFVFAGGVIWDLRWLGMPGMSSLINVSAVSLAAWIWARTPTGGRTVPMFALLAAAAHVMSGVLHYLSWDVPSRAALRLFAIQQLIAVPVLIVLCFVFSYRSRETHV